MALTAHFAHPGFSHNITHRSDCAPCFSVPDAILRLLKPVTPHLGNARYTNVIFDLGDVLFTYSTSLSESPVPAKTLRHILRSSTWFEYEKGNLTEAQAYAQVAKEYDLSLSNVECAIRVARGSLKSNHTLLNMVARLRASGRRIFAMSNMSAPDWEVVATKLQPSEWALFEAVFISAKVGERKPHTAFYKHVLEQTGIDPTRTIFVDDKIENVVTARSFGMHGIVFDNTTNLMQQLEYLCGDHVQRGKLFLYANQKHFPSQTSTGVTLDENFSQLLIQEATGDKSIVDYAMSPRLSNFFPDTCPESLIGLMYWKEQFPDDLDTASIAMTVETDVDSETKHSIMDEMLSFRDNDGLVQVYFDQNRPRLDPVVCVNVLTLFYRNDRGHELENTLDWVYACLLHRAYIDGTLYYATPETFLFFLARLLQSAPYVHRRFEHVFRERVVERFGARGNSLALAMRIVAAASVGLVCRCDVDVLLSMQREDGSWGEGWYYKFGSSGILIGNDGLTTALAIKAIEVAQAILAP